jgi:hypothetical protein
MPCEQVRELCWTARGLGREDRDALLCQLNSYPGTKKAAAWGVASKGCTRLISLLRPRSRMVCSRFRIDEALHHWHARKLYYLLCFVVLEPTPLARPGHYRPRPLLPESAWKRNSLLTDFWL